MENNIYTNKELYSYHFDKNGKQRRVGDFVKIYEVLKSHLEPKSKAHINEELCDSCNLCMIVCSQGAISSEWMPGYPE